MKTKTQKAIFLALSGVALLASTATATWVLLRQKHKVNAKNYEELKNKIKNKINLVISEKDRKDFENKINDPKYGSYSKSNGQAISDLLNNLENKINEETNEIKSVINQLNSSPIREKFLKRLDEAKDYVERKKVHDDAKLALALQKGRDINTEKAEAKKLIDKIQDQVLKDKLLKELEKADDILSVDKIKAEAEKELLSQGEKDLLKAQKDALKNKIDASKLSDTEKNKLKEKVDAATSTNFDSVNKEVNDKIKSSTDNADELLALDKKEVEDLISNVTDSSKKEELTNKLSSTSTPEEVAELKKEVEDTIKNQAFVDAKKEALIAKIDESSNLSAAEKERLKEQVNKVNDLESAIKAENDVNNAIAESNIRNKAKEVLELLKDGEIKNKLKNKLDSTNSIEDILEVIDQAEKILDDSRKEAKKVIDSIEDTNKKNALNEELAKAKTQAEIEVIKNEALNYAAYERAGKEAQSKDLDKKEAESLVDQITDPAKKQELKDQLANATTEEKINEIKEAARNEIKAQAELAANKKALKDKIDASTLDADKKNELKAKVDEATSANFDTTKSEVDAELNKDQTPEKILELNKKEAESLVDQITDPAKKQELKDQLTNATTEEKINEIKEAARNEIKAQAELAANKKALKDKIDASTLPENKKEELKAKVDAATPANFDVTSKEVNNAILLDVLEDKTKDTINKLSDGPQKDKLKTDLANASEPREVLEILKEAEAHLEEVKKAAEAEIEKIKDPVKKEELKSELANATTEDEYNAIKAKAEEENGTSNRKKAEDAVAKLSDNNPLKAKLLKELEKNNQTENELEYIKNQANAALNEFKKEALASVEKTKGSQEYEGLLEKVNAKNTTEDQLKTLKEEADNIFKIKKDAVKASQDLNSLPDDNVEKEKLNADIEKAENIFGLDLLFKKAEVLKEISTIKADDQREILILELNRVDIKANNADEFNENHTQLENIKAKAALKNAEESGDQFEIAKAKASLLPYPGGVEAAAIKEIQAKIDAIKTNDSLDTSEKKIAKIREIEATFNDLESRINDAKMKIAELSPEKQNELNNLLNETNLIKEEVINTPEEFNKLEEAINAAKNADKIKAKEFIEGLVNLTPEEKQREKNKIDAEDINTYDKIKEIVDQAKLIDKKKELEAKAKKLQYPAGESSEAIRNIIERINATDTEEAPTTLEKAEAFEGIISDIAAKIISTKSKYSTLSEPSEDITNKFNAADTNEEFEELNRLLDEAIANQDKADKKERLDRLVNNLAYPDSNGDEVSSSVNNAPAIADIKKIYEDNSNEKMDEVLSSLDKIRDSIASSKEELAKISDENKKTFKETDDSAPVNLYDELRNANTTDEFEELKRKIALALEKDKTNAKNQVDQIADLTNENKTKFKELIDAANNYSEIEAIIEDAKIEAKRDALKAIITINDYMDEGSNRTSEITSSINKSLETIASMIDNTPHGELEAKRSELNSLKEKITSTKEKISNLAENDVIDLNNIQNELFSNLATKTDIPGVESVNLEIDKAKLRKTVSSLQYPGNQGGSETPVTAKNDLNRRIDDVSNVDDFNSLKTQIEGLPAKIQDALSKIDQISNNTISSEQVEERKRELKEELDRADTEPEFVLLLENIERAKTQSAEDFRNGQKHRLKRRAELLPYPKGASAPAIEIIKNTIESSSNLETWDNELTNIENKILDAKSIINKVAQDQQNELNESLDSSDNVTKIEEVIQNAESLLNAEKTRIASEINNLEFLSQERKAALVTSLNDKSSTEMNEILRDAKKEDLEAAINALPYPNTNATGKATLLSIVRNLNDNSSIDTKLAEIKELKTSILTTITKINELPYPDGTSASGANSLKSRLNSLTNKDTIDSLVPSDLSTRIQEYKDILNTELNPFPTDAREYGLKRRINELNGSNLEDENELKWQLYETKRRHTLNPLINALDSLSARQKEQLRAEAPEVLEANKRAEFPDFKAKIANLDNVILKAQKENAKAHIDSIQYPSVSGSEVSRTTLKNAIENSANINEINTKKAENERIKVKMAEIRSEIQGIRNETNLQNIRQALDSVDSYDDFAAIELSVVKAKAIDYVSSLGNLTPTQINDFTNRINSASNETDINNIKANADLQNRKEQIKSIITGIGYPHTNQASNASKEALKNQVETLTTNQQLDEKERSINEFKQLMERKVASITSLPYPSTSSNAVNEIKNELDRATTIERVNQILPDDWSEKVGKYKETIISHFGSGSGLLVRLDKTHPTKQRVNDNDNFTVENLNFQVLETKKVRTNELVNALPALNTTEKASFTRRITAVQNQGNGALPEANKLNDIDQIYKEALSAAIAKLPNGNAKKTDLERRMTQNPSSAQLATIKNELQAEKTLLDSKRTEAENAVNALPANNAVKATLEAKLNNVSESNEANKLQAIKNAAEAEKSIVDKKNSIIRTINGIGFPAGANATAVTTLTNQVNALSSTASLEEKEREIEALRNAMNGKSSAARNLPYRDTANGRQAKARIIELLNEATTAERVNQLLPATWHNDLSAYKNIIESNFGRTHGLLDRLDQTRPDRTDDFSISNLENQVLLTKKSNKKSEIDRMSHLTEAQRNSLKAEVDAVQNTDPRLPDNANLAKIDAIAAKANAMNLAKEKVNSLPENNNVKNRLLNRLNSTNLAQSEYESIKREAETELLNIAKAEARAEINKLSPNNPSRNSLTSRLNSANTVEAVNRIKEEAIAAKANDLTDKKNEVRAEINKLDNSNPDKASLLDRTNISTSREVLDEIKNEAKVSNQKNTLKNTFNSLPYFDLSSRNGVRPRANTGENRGDANVYTLQTLPGLIDSIKTTEEANKVSEFVNKQLNAINEDLRKTATDRNGNAAESESLMKTKLLEKLYADREGFWDPNDTHVTDQFALYSEIRNLTTIEQYKNAERKLDAFIKKYYDPAVAQNNVKRRIIERFARESRKPLPISNYNGPDHRLPENLINSFEREVMNTTTEAEALEVEKRYLTVPYLFNRLSKQIFWNYTYIVRTGPSAILNTYPEGIEKQAIQRNLNSMGSVNTLEQQERVANELLQLTDNNPYVRKWKDQIFHTRLVQWWVNNIVHTNKMTIEQKYQWIDKITWRIDENGKYALNALRNEFVQAGFESVLNENNNHPHPTFIFPSEFIDPNWPINDRAPR